MSDRDPALSIRDPSLGAPYLTLVNVSRSRTRPDDWRIALVEPDKAKEHGPSIGRGLWFAIPLSGALWGALYALWRLCAG
jgi:hypothetical protein